MPRCGCCRRCCTAKAIPTRFPFTGSGTEASIAALTRDDLVAFHRDWVRPEGATLVVVGDTTLAEIVPLLEKHLGDWRGRGAAPAVPACRGAAAARPARVFLVDQPGAIQANIFVGQLVPSTRTPARCGFDIANGVIGGTFTSRLNMNLREDKHWSYGARSFVPARWASAVDRIGAGADRQDRRVDRRDQARTREFASGKRPPAPTRSRRSRRNVRSLPGSYETAGAVMGTIGGIVRYDRPDDYVFRRKAEIEAMTPAQVAEAARTDRPPRP
jgi:zinc protease